MPTASIKFTSDYLVEACRRYRRQHRGRYASLALKLLALALLAPVAVWLVKQGHIAVGVVFAALGVFMFLAHHVDHWLARRSFRRSPYRDEDLTIEFSEAGFHAQSPKQDVRLRWSAFTTVAHFSDGFLLFQGPKLFTWIPLSSLARASESAELDALLRARIPEHRIVEPAGPRASR